MRAGAEDLHASKMVPPDSEDDPYRHLGTAILHRAVQDAQGRCLYPGSRSPFQLEAEARAWLADANGAAALVELAGFDPEPVLRRVRALLAPDRVQTP